MVEGASGVCARRVEGASGVCARRVEGASGGCARRVEGASGGCTRRVEGASGVCATGEYPGSRGRQWCARRWSRARQGLARQGLARRGSRARLGVARGASGVWSRRVMGWVTRHLVTKLPPKRTQSNCPRAESGATGGRGACERGAAVRENRLRLEVGADGRPARCSRHFHGYMGSRIPH